MVVVSSLIPLDGEALRVLGWNQRDRLGEMPWASVQHQPGRRRITVVKGHLIAEDYFWSRIDRRTPDGCWAWKKGRTSAGYGHLSWGGRILYAHRIAWELHHGKEIPPRMCVLHSCDYPPCCNPGHLFLGSKVDNTLDMMKKGRDVTHRKLTVQQVLDLRGRNRVELPAVAAARLDVREGTIRDVLARRTWRWLPHLAEEDR